MSIIQDFMVIIFQAGIDSITEGVIISIIVITTFIIINNVSGKHKADKTDQGIIIKNEMIKDLMVLLNNEFRGDLKLNKKYFVSDELREAKYLQIEKKGYIKLFYIGKHYDVKIELRSGENKMITGSLTFYSKEGKENHYSFKCISIPYELKEEICNIISKYKMSKGI